MNDRTAAESGIDRLLEQSSLGTRGARRLRARTSPREAELTRRFSELQVEARDGSVAALLELAELSLKLGLYDKAEHYYRQVAAHSLAGVARIREMRGELAEAELWKARADTL